MDISSKKLMSIFFFIVCSQSKKFFWEKKMAKTTQKSVQEPLVKNSNKKFIYIGCGILGSVLLVVLTVTLTFSFVQSNQKAELEKLKQELLAEKNQNGPNFEVVNEEFVNITEEDVLKGESNTPLNGLANTLVVEAEAAEFDIEESKVEDTAFVPHVDEQPSVDEEAQGNRISVFGEEEDYVVIKKSSFNQLKAKVEFLTKKNIELTKQQLEDEDFYKKSLAEKDIEHNNKITNLLNDYNSELSKAMSDKEELMAFIKDQDSYIEKLRGKMLDYQKQMSSIAQAFGLDNQDLTKKIPDVSKVKNIQIEHKALRITNSAPVKAAEESKAEQPKQEPRKILAKETKKENPLTNFKLVGLSTDYIVLENKENGKKYTLTQGEKISKIALTKIDIKNKQAVFANGYKISIGK